MAAVVEVHLPVQVLLWVLVRLTPKRDDVSHHTHTLDAAAAEGVGVSYSACGVMNLSQLKVRSLPLAAAPSEGGEVYLGGRRLRRNRQSMLRLLQMRLLLPLLDAHAVVGVTGG